MKAIKTLIAAGLAAQIASAALAQNDPRVLTIASWAGPSHVVNAEMWPQFIDKFEEISDGELTAEVKLNLVPPPAMADFVLDGAADITFIFHGYNAGRFVVPQLVELPGVEGDAEAASAAYWRVWKSHLEAAGEQDEFKTLAMFQHGAAQLHLTDPIDGLDAVDGMKIRAPGGVGSLAVEGLGGVGIQVPATKVYETLSAGAADAVTMNTDSRVGYNLDEVAPVIFEIPGGLYRGSFAVLMRKETWNSIDPELREALDEEFFGEPMSRLFGRIWAAGDERAMQAARDAGSAIISASDEDIAHFAPIVENVTATVLERVNGRGIDAEAAKAAFEKEIAAVMAEIDS
ncbi:TRAP-type C4-dicarboxylate transport system, substrate-binding protein [Salinihabitans flavidus]|uniref:TRAP-type C4-dicarboxylate transport system, substrate-binding protein n=1 Tax=Salinihabitans flavidus TaxID=569882 RepID=A0A1H8RJS8_9RHOB|nr:TRAP transporter substrate-binding protein [Salinihabitans flavidus]SEO66606.1 TRAP-type C4-dicarboxylate transport system, substrate-binding protein [Salinihabitans flavidus]